MPTKGLEVTYSVVMILFHNLNIEKVKHLQYPKAVQGRKRLQYGIRSWRFESIPFRKQFLLMNYFSGGLRCET